MMSGAALGLTCKDAFVIFSQNETLALQRKVLGLEARLLRYEPDLTRDKVNPNALLHQIKDKFDALYPISCRVAPVVHIEEASKPFPAHKNKTCIWSGMLVSVGCGSVTRDDSLRGLIEKELLAKFGEGCKMFCLEQSSSALVAIQRALVGGYMSSYGWERFRKLKVQEHIVWVALFEHLLRMKSKLLLGEEHIDDHVGSGDVLKWTWTS
jgi:hypothetical protein